MELTLNSYKIFELGDMISKKLHENGLEKKSELIINVSPEELRKIDEDLFYRKNDKTEEYIPTEGELEITFEKLVIIVKAVKEKS